jgi:hypothetical protein
VIRNELPEKIRRSSIVSPPSAGTSVEQYRKLALQPLWTHRPSAAERPSKHGGSCVPGDLADVGRWLWIPVALPGAAAPPCVL